MVEPLASNLNIEAKYLNFQRRNIILTLNIEHLESKLFFDTKLFIRVENIFNADGLDVKSAFSCSGSVPDNISEIVYQEEVGYFSTMQWRNTPICTLVKSVPTHSQMHSLFSTPCMETTLKNDQVKFSIIYIRNDSFI